MKKICHANVSCLDARFCLPHGEDGKVEYNIGLMLAYIKQLEKTIKKLGREIEDYKQDILDKKD